MSAEALAAARLELHWAAQIVSAAGATLLPPKEDASHTNLRWDGEARALVGEPIEGKVAGLVLDNMTLVVLSPGVMQGLPLVGKTLDEATAWLASTFDAPKLTRPTHELPDHPVGHGERFGTSDIAARIVLARWFANADRLLGMIARSDPRASPVRCWPHHFDIATLVQVDPKHTVGAGFSPGDGTYPDPYFYVTPWPYPDADATLPALTRGHWHLAGWTGAVLESKDVDHDPDHPAIAPWVAESLRASLALVSA